MLMIKDPGYELTRHKKKANKKPHKKINHVHDYQDCVLSVPSERFDRSHGFVPDVKLRFAKYCTICGKIDSLADEERARYIVPTCRYPETYTELGQQEINSATRTLPCFKLKAILDKYVEV